MRIVFFGGHTLGMSTLQYLLNKEKNIVAVATDALNEWYKGVDEVAEKNNILLFKDIDVNSESFINSIRKLEPDLIVVVNFQQILKDNIISVPKFGCINTHAALLPKYRGRAPLNWALINGEKHVGVTVHFIERGIDTGNIILQQSIEVDEQEYIDSVLEKVIKVYPLIVDEAIDRISSGEATGIVQDLTQGCYFGKRTAQDGLINWGNNANDIFNLIRAVSRPYPGAFSFYDNNKVIIWRAVTIEQKKEERNLRNGFIIKNDANGICVKAKNKNILITEYEVSDKNLNIKEKHFFVSERK